MSSINTSSTSDFTDFDFSGSVRQLSQGLLVRPLLENYLYDAKFPAFSVHFPEQQMERKPDDHFHPSTHPRWTEQALYRYIAHPDTFPLEKKQFMGTLAVTMGKVYHEFIQMCLEDAGVLPRAWQVCKMCPPKADCHEAGFSDPVLGERGHCDGLMDLSSLGPRVPEALRYPVFEFKTSNDNFGKLQKIEDLDLETFKKKWPDYYGQQQRYMKAWDRTMSVVLFMEPGYPFTMREFHVPLDRGYNLQVDEKYRRVRQAVADQREPFCCRSKGCPAAALCGV